MKLDRFIYSSRESGIANNQRNSLADKLLPRFLMKRVLKNKKYYLSGRNGNANVSSGISARGDFFQRKIQHAHAYETKWCGHQPEGERTMERGRRSARGQCAADLQPAWPKYDSQAYFSFNLFSWSSLFLPRSLSIAGRYHVSVRRLAIAVGHFCFLSRLYSDI